MKPIRIVVLASSFCPLMKEEGKMIVQACWQEGLAVGKTGSCSGGQGHVQWIFNSGSCAPSQLVVWLRCPVLELTGSMVGLKTTSRRTYANMHLSGLWLPEFLSPQQAKSDLHLCRRPSNTHRQVWLSFLWSHCSFPLGPGEHKVLFVPSKSLCFPQSCGSSVIKFHCT